MTQNFYDDVATKLMANMSATRPNTAMDVLHVVDFDGDTLAVNFDVRVENELLRITAISVDTPVAGTDRWTASHIGGAAASTHGAGQEVEVVLTKSGLGLVSGADDDSAYMPTAGGTFTGDVEFEAQIVDDTENAGTNGDVLTKVSGRPRWQAGGGGGSIAGASDVVLTSLADDDSLTWDSATSKWVNEAITGGGGGSLSTLSDVDLTGFDDGDILTYVAADSKWEAKDDPDAEGEVDTGFSGVDIIIPGLAGSADVVPASPNVDDDEFDQNAAGTPSGWTAFNTPDTLNTNDNKSHVHIVKASGSGDNYFGIVKAKTNPTSFPWTVVAKIADLSYGSSSGGNYAAAFLFIADGAPGSGVKGYTFGVQKNTAGNTGGPVPAVAHWSGFYNIAAAGGASDNPAYGNTVFNGAPSYIKVIVHAANNIEVYLSLNGKSWFLLVNSLGYLASATHVGLCVDNQNNFADAYFDWIRFS
jgi:hypothetical protein